MRIRRIDLGGAGPRSISLHPQLTVVRGLRGPHRQRLIDAIAALPDEAVAGVSGEVEADGEVLPLEPVALGAFGLSHDRLDNVVRASQFPGGDAPAVPVSPRRAAEMSRDALARRLAGARSRLADAAARRVALLDEREDARRREEAADAMAVEAAAMRDELSAELAGAQARRATAAAEAEAAEAAHRVLAEEPVPEEEALDQARARHAAVLEARAGAERSLAEARQGLDPDAAQPPAGRADLLERRSQLEAALVALAEVDPTPVADALAVVRTRTAAATVGPPEEAGSDGSLDLGLAEPSDRSTPGSGEEAPEHASAEGPTDTGGADPEAAEAAIAFEAELSEASARVDEAMATLAEAQAAAAAAAELDPEVVVVLEAAHAEVLAAQKRQGRFGRRARNRLDEARRAEQQVLGQHDFTSYAEYAMSLAPSSQFLENPAVAEARADVIAAEVALAGLEAEAERRAADERSKVLELDEPPRGMPGSSGGDAVADLRGALIDAGLVVHTTGDPTEDAAVVVSLAEQCLEEQAAAGARRLEIEAQLAELDADLARLDEALADPSVAEQRHARHSEAEARVAALDEEVDACRAEVDATAADVAAAEENLGGLDRSALDAAAAALAQAQAALADAEAAERRAHERLADHQRDGAVRLATAPVDPPSVFEERLAAVTAAVEAAQAEAGLLEDELTALERRLTEGAFDEAADPSASDAAFEEGREAQVDEIEWYLMSRLSAQRTAGVGGSVPILFDDAFAELRGEEAVRLAAGVERLAGAVQVILLSDDDDLAAWAEGLGDERAAVVGAGLL